jgi:hypothetical protein
MTDADATEHASSVKVNFRDLSLAFPAHHSSNASPQCSFPSIKDLLVLYKTPLLYAVLSLLQKYTVLVSWIASVQV